MDYYDIRDLAGDRPIAVVYPGQFLNLPPAFDRAGLVVMCIQAADGSVRVRIISVPDIAGWAGRIMPYRQSSSTAFAIVIVERDGAARLTLLARIQLANAAQIRRTRRAEDALLAAISAAGY